MRVFRLKVLYLSFLLFFVNTSVSVLAKQGNSLNVPKRSEDVEAKAQQNVNTAANKETQKHNNKEDASKTEDSLQDGQTLRLEPRNPILLTSVFPRFIVRFYFWLTKLYTKRLTQLICQCFCSRSNATAIPYGNNETLHPTTSTKPTTTTPPTPKPILPVQTGVKAQEEEQSSGMTIFFSLLVIGWRFIFYLTVNISFALI